jgi:single-stranded DNA-binding protein
VVTVSLTGRLTRDPRLREVALPDDGPTSVCEVRIAARDARGRVVFLDCSQWGAGGRAAAEFLRKGSLVAFHGELRFDEVDGAEGRRQHYGAVGRIEFLGAAVVDAEVAPA